MRRRRMAWLVSWTAAAVACGSKGHVDIDTLGDAAIPIPPGLQGFQACNNTCATAQTCLFNTCASQCQEDRDCAAGLRCLITDQGNGCVSSSQAGCNNGCPNGTTCDGGECRNQCSRCAPDQSCRGQSCYGSDTKHDPEGGFGGTGGYTGGGGYPGTGGQYVGGAGFGGMGGSCPTDSCSTCLCRSCSQQAITCFTDSGCAAIVECMSRNGCTSNCYSPENCQGTIDGNGGPSGNSYQRALGLNGCREGQCKASCDFVGPADAGSGLPSAGYWRFDEGYGSNAVDSSGNGHNGTLNNGPAWTPGIAGQALSFNGSNQFVMLHPGPILGVSSHLTIEAWVRWNGMQGGEQAIYSEGGYSALIELYLREGIPGFSIFGSALHEVNATYPIAMGDWHHVAGVYMNGMGGTLYVDGQYAGSNPNMDGTFQAATETDVGRFVDAGIGGSRYFGGSIDDVRVFTYGRTPGEIMNDFYNPGR
jgi:hypothetical protein